MIENRQIPLSQIESPKLQPRLNDDDDEIPELALSIQTHGLLSPLIVVANDDGYQLLAGNRRLKALHRLGRTSAACRVLIVDSDSADQITIAENLIRRNLSSVEEAYAFAMYLQRVDCSHEDLAQRIGKERTYVTRRLMLLDLDDVTLGALEDKVINLSQALLLRQLDNPEIRQRFIQHAQQYGANVRTMSIWVANYKKEQARARAEENRELQPDEFQPAREVYMECDRCGEPTTYSTLRPAYLCNPCRQSLYAYRVAKGWKEAQ